MYKDRIPLNDGNSIPPVGFGVYLIDEAKMQETIQCAYQAGYRLFDTASFYKNEAFLGDALQKLKINRTEIQLATKAWPSELGYDGVKEALHRSLKRLQTDYVDLYYIHWPLRDAKRLSETWTAMEEMKDEGLIRSIAVCNFHPHHLEVIEKGHKYLPAIDQIERHPLLTQKDVIAYNRSKNILTEAWSPLMRGKRVMELEPIQKIAQKYGKSPAQVVLRWDVQEGIVPIPKSVTPSRIRENIDIFDFSLTQEEINIIDAQNTNERSSNENPDDYPHDPTV